MLQSNATAILPGVLRKCIESCLTKDIDDAGGGGNSVSVLHLDGEVAMIRSDCVTDQQCRFSPLGLVQTKTLA